MNREFRLGEVGRWGGEEVIKFFLCFLYRFVLSIVVVR